MKNIAIGFLSLALIICLWQLNKPETDSKVKIFEKEMISIAEPLSKSKEPVQYENIRKFEVPLVTIDRLAENKPTYSNQNTLPDEDQINQRKQAHHLKEEERKRNLMKKVIHDADFFSLWVQKNTKRFKNDHESLKDFQNILSKFENNKVLIFEEVEKYL